MEKLRINLVREPGLRRVKSQKETEKKTGLSTASKYWETANCQGYQPGWHIGKSR